MKSILALACIYFAAVATPLAAGSVLLTFDDLPTLSNLGTYVPNGYGGLQWDTFMYFSPAVSGPYPSGYVNGTISPPNVAFNAYASPASLSSGVSFDLSSAYLTAAWNDGLQVEVQGFISGTLTYDNTYTLNTTSPQLINFNYLGVDQVTFSSSGGVNNNYPNGFGTMFAMDNLVLNAVPEPNALWLCGFGAFASMISRRLRAF